MKKEQYKVLVFYKYVWTPKLQSICDAMYQVDFSMFIKINKTSL